MAATPLGQRLSSTTRSSIPNANIPTICSMGRATRLPIREFSRTTSTRIVGRSINGLEFDWRAGWGTDAFEDALADGKFHSDFPPVWQNVDDRYDAREIVEENLKKLHYKKDLRRQVLENGSKVDGPFFAGNPGVGKALKFKYCVTNINPGHNMPSGSLGAQPQLWMNVVLIGPDGHRVWESGYVDSNGDLADNHSLDVLARRIPLDTQLFNLQTKFLTTNVQGNGSSKCIYRSTWTSISCRFCALLLSPFPC